MTFFAFIVKQIGSAYMKYKQIHEQTHPSKGDALKKRWNEHSEKQRALHEAKKQAAKAAAQQQEEQTIDGDG